MNKTVKAAGTVVLGAFLFFSLHAQIPRPEHPKPQFVREAWMNLNGTWNFEFDFGKSGEERGIMILPVFQKRLPFRFARRVNFLESDTKILCRQFGITGRLKYLPGGKTSGCS